MEINNVNDVRLIGRAISSRWPASDEIKAAALKALQEFITDPTANPRARLMAIDKLLKMESQNQTDDHAELQQEGNQFAAMLAHLRTEGDLEGYAETGSGNDPLNVEQKAE